MDMLSRFTDRARKVMAFANQEAQLYNSDVINTEHILLGFVKEGSGTGATVLKNLDVNIKKLRQELEKRVKIEPEMITMGKLPQAPLAKKVVEYAIEEAKALNHNFVGTEHILLGLLRESKGIAATVLMSLGLKLEDVRLEIISLYGLPEPKSLESITPLALLIDPGDATSEEISELFVELSTLYRMVGGSGINFTIVDAREPAIA